MRSKLLHTCAAILLAGGSFTAQVANYTFTQTMGSYGAPSTGSLVGFTFQDDDVTTVNLPFSFDYNGSSYNSINVCSNGYLSFDNLTGGEYPPISDNGTTNLISPFGVDLLMGVLAYGDLTQGSNTITNCSSVLGYSIGDVLIDYNSDFSGSPVITGISGNNVVVSVNAINTVTMYDIANEHGAIRHSVSGVAPNRVCEFEYANFSRFLVYDEVVNFKVRLYETSNKIEVVYGACVSGQDATTIEVGIKGNNNNDYNSRQVLAPGTWSTSMAAGAPYDFCDFYTGLAPLDGLHYIWGPPTCTVPVLTATLSRPNICKGESSILTGSGATSYTWTGGTPGSSQLTVSPTVTTTYTLTGANGDCTAQKTIVQTVKDCTGINENGAKAATDMLVAYPNPFSSSLSLNNTSDREERIVISDAVGKTVLVKTIAAGSTETVSTESFAKGLYIVTVSGTNGFAKKLIKE